MKVLAPYTREYVVIPRNMRAARVRQYVGACAVSTPGATVPKEEPMIKEQRYIGVAFVPYYRNSIEEGE